MQRHLGVQCSPVSVSRMPLAGMPTNFVERQSGSAQYYGVRELLRLAAVHTRFVSSSRDSFSPSEACPQHDCASKASWSWREYMFRGKASTPAVAQQPPRRHVAAKASEERSSVVGNGLFASDSPSAQTVNGTRYEPYVSLREALAGIASGKYKTGVLRVPKNRADDAYVANEIHGAPDYLIQKRQNRNRALHRDTVVFEILHPSCWVPVSNPYSLLKETGEVLKERSSDDPVLSDATASNANDLKQPLMHKTGRVVHVLEFDGKDRPYIAVLRENKTQASGTDMLAHPGKAVTMRPGDRYFKAVPLDTRIPWILIPVSNASEWFTAPNTVDGDTLFFVQITAWECHNALPVGCILGKAGRLSDCDVSEKVAMIDNGLEEHMLDFSEDVEAEAAAVLKKYKETFTQEAARRRDFRHCDIRPITIDPKTARDLDDAIHIRIDRTKNSTVFEIGVHIADVTHFVSPSSCIDQEARKRCTTVYLSRRNFPMLPRSLCDNLCSLTPDDDKLTFSVVFYLCADGTLCKSRPPWFGRSVIRTAACLNYDVTQKALDAFRLFGSSDEDAEQLLAVIGSLRPPSLSAKTWHEVWGDLIVLESLTQQVRTRRFEAGSLRLHKAQFHIDMTTLLNEGVPIPEDVLAGVCQTDAGDDEDVLSSSSRETAHHMIEELMLLANRLVAEKLYNSCLREFAVLRYHPTPKAAGLRNLERFLAEVGITADFSDVRAMFSSLEDVGKSHGQLIEYAIESLIMASMYAANYAVAAECPSHHHFALNFPLYTHFTSPIRRYADVMVHRLLFCVLAAETLRSPLAYASGAVKSVDDGNAKVDSALLEALAAKGHTLNAEDLMSQCDACNEKRLQAQAASEECSIYFFCNWLYENTRMYHTMGTVLVCQDKSISVYISSLGASRRLYYNNCQTGSKNAASNGSNNLQKLPRALRDALVVPISITIKNKHTIEFLWEMPPGKAIASPAHNTSNKAGQSAERVLGTHPLTGKRIRQVIRTFGLVPVSLVPLDTVPRSFAAFATPPWAPEFSSTLLNSPLLTCQQQKTIEAAYVKGMKTGFLDLGGCGPARTPPNGNMNQLTLDETTVTHKKRHVGFQDAEILHAANASPVSQQKALQRTTRAQRTAKYKEGLQATARIIEFNTTQRTPKKEGTIHRRAGVKGKK